MKETFYWLPHSTIFFSWLMALNSQFKCVPWSDTRQLSGKISIPMHHVHTWRLELCSFNLSLHQETKKRGQNDCYKRRKSLKGGKLNSRSSLLPCARQIHPALVCTSTCLSSMLQSCNLGMYHGRCTLHGFWSNRVIRKWMCVFWNIHVLPF